MTENQSAAYVFSQSVCALIEAMGMRAENEHRKARSEAPAYLELDFMKLQEKYPIGHNLVIGLFQQC